MFNFYYYDLSEALSQTGIGCHINNRVVNHLIYADDLCILATTISALQALVNCSATYATNHDVIVNTKKAKVMTITPKSMSNVNFGKITFNGTVLTETCKEKYLEYWLTNDNRDDYDMIMQKGKLYARINLLISTFSACCLTVKILLFKAFALNIYGLSLWRRFYNYNLVNIRAAYNKGLAKFFRVDYPYTASRITAELNLLHFTKCLKESVFIVQCVVH